MNLEQLQTIGKREARNRRKHTQNASLMLRKWIKEKGERKICPVCGETMPQTFHVHHI